MFTFIVITVLSVLWWRRWNRFRREPTWVNRRRSVAMLYAAIGAAVGSFFGIAGFGTAIAGTIPGAIVAYLVVSGIYKIDRDHASSPQADPQPSPAPAPSASQAAAPAAVNLLPPLPPATRIITCFHCGAKLEAPAHQRLTIRCGGCKGEFEVST